MADASHLRRIGPFKGLLEGSFTIGLLATALVFAGAFLPGAHAGGNGGSTSGVGAGAEPARRVLDAAAIVEPEMIRLPHDGQPLAFRMGSTEGELEEHPVHAVSFVQPFAIGKHEVTFDEYDVYASHAGVPLPSDEGWGRGRRPVINVSWDDAMAYARWLSDVTGKAYRLPTEAEWEYASRAGTRTVYWWGDEIGENRANCYGCGSRWDGEQTAPVGSFAANPWGLHDTLGNVWEWVADCWHDSYENAPPVGSAWSEADDGDCSRRVVRGGAWFNKPLNVRSALRFGADDVYRFPFLGFRLAQDLR